MAMTRKAATQDRAAQGPYLWILFGAGGVLQEGEQARHLHQSWHHGMDALSGGHPLPYHNSENAAVPSRPGTS